MSQTAAETMTHSVRWDQVLTNPAISTHSGDQTATIQGGTLALPPGYRVEFHYENPQPTPNEWNGETRIVRVDVFKETGDMVFAYKPMNPGQYARIQSDLSGVGDNYARIDLSVMRSNDPGAPQLGSIVITNGKNSFADLPDTFPRGNGAYDLIPSCPVPCFGPDVVVITYSGPTRMADVQQGDMVWGFDLNSGTFMYARVLWKGSRKVKADDQNAPVLFRGETFSPQHRIMMNLDGTYRWIKAKFLVDLGKAAQTLADGREVEYHHVLMQHHFGVCTEQSIAESLLNTETSRALFAGQEFDQTASTANFLDDVKRSELVDLSALLAAGHQSEERIPSPPAHLPA